MWSAGTEYGKVSTSYVHDNYTFGLVNVYIGANKFII